MNVLTEGATATGLGAIVTTIVEAIAAFFTGVGSAIVDFFNGIVLTPEGGLTTFATWTLVFMGVSFACTFIWALLRKVD
mgnify:CR=1 FL=1